MEKTQKKQTMATTTCYNSIVKIHVGNLLWTGVRAGCQPAENGREVSSHGRFCLLERKEIPHFDKIKLQVCIAKNEL